MKRYIYYISAVLILAISGCKKDFGDLNKNPNSLSTPTPAFLFSKSLLSTMSNSYYLTGVLNLGGFIQHYATYKEVSGIGDKYFANDFYQAPYFTDGYPTAVNEIEEVIRAVKETPGEVNKLNVARIWRVYIYHRMTDLYGDVPYSEAGKGLTSLNFTPKYDAQEAIYKDMLKELDEAASGLDAAKASYGGNDFIYGGDAGKWKKFAYSLMLRLGLRLTKMDLALSETWVKKAIAGGVILNKEDNAIMKYSDGPQDLNRNPTARESRSRDFSANSFGKNNIEGGKLSATFINYLKNNNDPRLGVYSGVWVGTTQDPNPAIQKGFPNGSGTAPSANDLGTYSEPNQNTVFRLDAPLLVLGNAETNLYLAEAAVRGWNTMGSASQFYIKGVTGSFDNAAMYGSAYAISSDKINQYLSSHPFDAAGTFDQQMEQIHTQIWAALYIDEYEVFSNWRRTGYPVLIPVNYPGNVTGGTIPRRLIYPNAEGASNAKNIQDAISRQGANTLTTRVWWDKQ